MSVSLDKLNFSDKCDGEMTDRMAENVRQERLSTLASASGAELMELWNRLEIDPACEMVRGPETGLVALRGRIGGGGGLAQGRHLRWQ